MLGACWAHAYFDKEGYFEHKPNFGKRTTGEKSSMQEEKQHARGESCKEKFGGEFRNLIPCHNYGRNSTSLTLVYEFLSLLSDKEIENLMF